LSFFQTCQKTTFGGMSATSVPTSSLATRIDRICAPDRAADFGPLQDRLHGHVQPERPKHTHSRRPDDIRPQYVDHKKKTQVRLV
jgi:hypothetical protein